jgi:iron(III) transport system ATP-binding protein
MAMSDRILLLNNGVIEQQGTPQEMYATPQTLFTADFMGSNNRLQGTVSRVDGTQATLSGDGWTLSGLAKPSAKQGATGTGVVRLENVRVAEGPGDNRVQPELKTSMFLGDKWEHVFYLGPTMLRAHGPQALTPGKHWVEIPRAALWIF